MKSIKKESGEIRTEQASGGGGGGGDEAEGAMGSIKKRVWRSRYAPNNNMTIFVKMVPVRPTKFVFVLFRDPVIRRRERSSRVGLHGAFCSG